MNYKLSITAHAEEDIRGIFEHIAYELQSPINAAKQIQRIEQEIMSLSEMPMRYRAYRKQPWRSKGLRVMSVNSYLVFYVPDKEQQTVQVIRVMYGGRNVDAELNRFAE